MCKDPEAARSLMWSRNWKEVSCGCSKVAKGGVAREEVEEAGPRGDPREDI